MCLTPAGSPCRTRSGTTAAKYHIARFMLVPALRDELTVPVPADRRTGRAWRLAAAVVDEAAAARGRHPSVASVYRALADGAVQQDEGALGGRVPVAAVAGPGPFPEPARGGRGLEQVPGHQRLILTHILRTLGGEPPQTLGRNAAQDAKPDLLPRRGRSRVETVGGPRLATGSHAGTVWNGMDLTGAGLLRST